jgi:hypothetical protein
MSDRPRRIDHPSGSAWYVSQQDRGEYAGGFFKTFTRAALDAAQAYTHTGELPAAFPFTFLGRPFVKIIPGGQKEFGFHGVAVEFVRSGGRFETLALRLRLLQAEYECFLTQREVQR